MYTILFTGMKNYVTYCFKYKVSCCVLCIFLKLEKNAYIPQIDFNMYKKSVG